MISLRPLPRSKHACCVLLRLNAPEQDASRQLTVHACFLCLDDFRRRNGDGRFPIPGSASDANAFVSLVRNSPFFIIPSASPTDNGGVESEEELDKERMPVDESVAEAFARTCAGSLSPLAAFYGGVVAQEVLKG